MTPAKPTRVRYGLLVMLFITVVINYLDRNNLSVATIDIAKDLGLDPKQKGWLLSAFGWTYAALQIPGGWLVDKIRPRYFYALICGLWSLATVVQGLAGTFVFLFALRLLVGAFEAPAYPILNRLVTTWFPDRERAFAIGFYTSGQFVGLAFLLPVLTQIQHKLGWHYIFFLTGALGLAWAVFWYWRYREPAESRRANPQELDYIRRGGGLIDAVPTSSSQTRFRWTDLFQTLAHRKLWGIYIGQFAVTSTMWFFLTWFPSYLVDYRKMSFIKAGYVASLPFITAYLGVLCSGWISDFLVKRGFSATTARKIPIISGLLMATTIVGARFIDDPKWVLFFLGLAGFGNGFASIAWVMVSALAPKRLVGLTGGMFNFFGNLSSITVPLIIGQIVGKENFAPAFVFLAAITLSGALSYIFLVGRVERIEERAA
jgi:ACS family D-galactonate transporter-like MFS transporter